MKFNGILCRYIVILQNTRIESGERSEQYPLTLGESKKCLTNVLAKRFAQVR